MGVARSFAIRRKFTSAVVACVLVHVCVEARMCVLFKVICMCEVREYADDCVGVHMLFSTEAKW